MNSSTGNANLENTNQAWSSWGYDLVCAQINGESGAGSSAKGDLSPLFEYVSGHETCFLEFKATPFKPKEKHSNENPHGYKPDETADDYAWNVVKSIIALANTAGGAVILGVTDKGHEPILNIAKEHWAGDKWDEFSRNFFRRIFRKSYDIVLDTQHNSSPARNHRLRQQIKLFDTASDALKELCDIKCCHYQGQPLPVILVHAVQDESNLIYITEDLGNDISTEALLVRSKGDIGESVKLFGHKIRAYSQPDRASYFPSNGASGIHPKAYWHNLPAIPDFFGRDTELEQLNRMFTSDGNIIPWIHGDPGIGKTAFIQKFIKNHCRENSASIFDITFLLNAQGQTFAQSICQLSSYASKFKDFCGIELNDGTHNPLDDIFKSANEGRPQIFKAWAHELIKRLNAYRGPGKILIVLDSVDNSSFLNEPQLKLILDEAYDGRVRFCIVSRGQPANGERAVRFQLDCLNEEDTLNILNSKRPILRPEELASAKQIVKRLKCHAWAISHVATQLENDPDPDAYTRKSAELKKERSLKLTGKYPREGLKTLYAPSIKRLEDKAICDDKALPLFALSAWFPQESIPADWLRVAFERYLYHTVRDPLDSINEDEEWERQIETLEHEGLIHWQPENNTYRTQTFGQDILWDLHETYCVWQSVFEIFRETVIAYAKDSSSFSQCCELLLYFIDLTVSQAPANRHDRDICDGNKRKIAKWIASEPSLRNLLRNAVSNFGENKRITNICDRLSEIAQATYKAEKNNDEAARHYIFFRSIQKIIAAKWDSNPNKFKEISQDIRTTFETLSKGSKGIEKEEAEILFAEGLISDAKQNAKLDHYAIVENDLETALEIIQKYKANHLELLIKSYLEKARIDLEFKQFDKVKACIGKIKKFARKGCKTLPKDDLLRFCKEQLAYMYLCKSESSTGMFLRYFSHKARKKYSALIKELTSLPDKAPDVQRSSRKLLLFKSHYFSSIAFLLRIKKLKDGNKKKDEFIHQAYDKLIEAFDMCDDIFSPTAEDEKATAAFLQFNKLRIQAGIYRLCDQLEEAQAKDREAYAYYESNITDEANLEIADLEDDYGNTYALQDNFEKAIYHLNIALSIREKRLPPTHVKIRNSNSRLAYLYGIHAMRFGDLAHHEIVKLIDVNGRSKDSDRLRASPEALLKKLKKITEFEKDSRDKFIEQLRKDEQKEESDRVRTVIAELQEKLFDKWVKDHQTNQ